MKALRQALLLLVVSAVAAAATLYLHPRAPALYQVNEPPRDDEVTLETIAQRWHNDVLWIDARPQEQFTAAHAPGALLINEQDADNQLADHMEEIAASKKPIVVYCSSDTCEAARKMREYILQRVPVEQIYILRGGWKTLEKHLADFKAKAP